MPVEMCMQNQIECSCVPQLDFCWVCESEDGYTDSVRYACTRRKEKIPMLIKEINSMDKEDRQKCFLWLKYGLTSENENESETVKIMIKKIDDLIGFVYRSELLELLKYDEDELLFRGVSMHVKESLKNHLFPEVNILLENMLKSKLSNIPNLESIENFLRNETDPKQWPKLSKKIRPLYDLKNPLRPHIVNIGKILKDPKYTNYVQEGRVDREGIKRSKESVIANEQHLIVGLVLKSFVIPRAIEIFYDPPRKTNEYRTYSASVQKYHIRKYLDDNNINTKHWNYIIHKVHDMYGTLPVSTYEDTIAGGLVPNNIKQHRTLRELELDVLKNKRKCIEKFTKFSNLLATL